jgi:hypothetical protein
MDALTAGGELHAGTLARFWQSTGTLRAGVVSGAIFGFLFGGVGGRLVMRVIALVDESTDGAETDFGTIGEITVGGTFTLAVLATIAGAIGGVLYVTARRWLPSARLTRGLFFGLLMMFGPGVIAVSQVDLQIVEPALPIFATFVALIVLYGISVALLADRLHMPPPVTSSQRLQRTTHALQALVAVGICAMAILAAYNVNDKAGTCFSADQNTGGCAIRAP